MQLTARRGSRRFRPRHPIAHLVLCLGAIFMVGPFLWQLSTSLQTFGESVSVPPTFLPHSPQWSNVTTVFSALPFGRELMNTTVMTIARTVGQVLFSSLAGFAFARMRFRGNAVLFAIFLSVTMVPYQVFLLPQYQIMQGLGLLNTLTALFLPGMFSAFGTFLMRQFFRQIPMEIEEAARIDGANILQIFWRIMLPMSAPGMIALGVLVIIWSWNDLLWPLVVNSDPRQMPVSAGLASLQGQYTTNFPVLMAGSLLASLPVIIVFIVFQRHLMSGIAFSGVKG
ncbi:carbohydrate ABC transporter permease [Kribbella pittospori]|uniref:Carbohydrate ABC transporter permease n=2 Tax=Kribbella pittospori TaxID=722689 RepID=A0A4R0K8N0_9ACTN|nr:carbohydrate ABC transporter permease [Kribbella pittospori]